MAYNTVAERYPYRSETVYTKAALISFYLVSHVSQLVRLGSLTKDNRASEYQSDDLQLKQAIRATGY